MATAVAALPISDTCLVICPTGLLVNRCLCTAEHDNNNVILFSVKLTK